MPRYYFRCECGETKAVIRKPEKANDLLQCPKCKWPMKRDPQGATSKIVETRDNGLMSRRVEQPADVERLNWERSHKPEDRKP